MHISSHAISSGLISYSVLSSHSIIASISFHMISIPFLYNIISSRIWDLNMIAHTLISFHIISPLTCDLRASHFRSHMFRSHRTCPLFRPNSTPPTVSSQGRVHNTTRNRISGSGFWLLSKICIFIFHFIAKTPPPPPPRPTSLPYNSILHLHHGGGGGIIPQ